jgi:poly-beta-1,6-N-acetyl-D-glucosamine synthase
MLAFEGIPFYQLTFLLQIGFYLLVWVGFLLKNREVKVKAVFVPYYFFIMNYAVFAGILRYIKREQTVTWERAKRAT